MFWDRPNLREQAHREAVLRNLLPLAELSKVRGGEIEVDVNLSTAKLEKLLWEIVNGLAKRLRLDFPPSMPCEERIMLIRRHLPAMPRPGQNPFLMEIADCPFFRK